MRVRVRPYLMAGVAVVAAGSISLPTSVTPPSAAAARHDQVALTAQTRTFDALPAAVVAVRPPAPGEGPTELPKLLAQALESTPTAVPAAQASALAFPGLSNAIIDTYYTVMPWVDWGVNLAVYATEWIPIVNWFTPQFDIFYYNLIRPIITSAVFNIAYWVGGTVSFGQGLTNFFNDTVAAGIDFVNAEINWFLSFLPPLPPFFPLAAASEAVMAIQGARTAVQIPATAGAPEDTETADTIDSEVLPGTPAEPTAPVETVDPGPTEPAVEAPQTPAEPTQPAPETKPAAPSDTDGVDEDEDNVSESNNTETKDDETKDSESTDDETKDDETKDSESTDDETKDDETKDADEATDADDSKAGTTKPGTTKPGTTKPDTGDSADTADSRADTKADTKPAKADKADKSSDKSDKSSSDS